MGPKVMGEGFLTKLVWGEEIHLGDSESSLFAHKMVAFFATKQGWGIDPRDPRQKIKTYRPRFSPLANSSKNAHMSVLAFHRFIYLFLKIKGVFSYLDN